MSLHNLDIFDHVHTTGYVGGSVLTRLLALPDADKYEITALVRSPEKAKKLETFGVKTVVGSIQDVALLTRLAEQAHVVFSLVSSSFSNDGSRLDINAACSQVDCDDEDQARAIVSGLKKRHDATRDIPIVIHAVRLYSRPNDVYLD